MKRVGKVLALITLGIGDWVIKMRDTNDVVRTPIGAYTLRAISARVGSVLVSRTRRAEAHTALIFITPTMACREKGVGRVRSGRKLVGAGNKVIFQACVVFFQQLTTTLIGASSRSESHKCSDK